MSRQVRMRIALLDVDVAEDVLKANPDLASYIEIVTIQAPAAKGQQNAGSVAAIRMGNNILTRHTHMVQDLDTRHQAYEIRHVVMNADELSDMANGTLCSTCNHPLGFHRALSPHWCTGQCSCVAFTQETAVPV